MRISVSLGGEAVPVKSVRTAIPRTAINWEHFGWSVAAIAVTVGAALILGKALTIGSAGMLFLVPVLISAVYFGLRAALFTTVVSVLSYNFFFLPPLYTFTISDRENVVALFFFGLVAVIASNLASRVRDQVLTARERFGAPGAVRGSQLLWRRTTGGSQFVVTISTKDQLLLPEERLLAVMRWILENTPRQKRWYPVLLRYIDDIAGRVTGFGGDPGSIRPSSTGEVPGLHRKPRPPRHDKDERELTGKIEALVYDHLGDFAGFILETEHGHRHRFESRESGVRELAGRAWVERIRVTVVIEPDRPHIPLAIILHSGGGRLFGDPR